MKLKLFLSVCLFVLMATINQTKAQVEVQISIKQPQHHLAQITQTFTNVNQPHLVVKMPVWRTGRYEILKLANGVRHFTAKTKNGKALTWQKLDKSSWQINTLGNSTVEISYQLYANSLGKRTRHIDESHAFLDASATIMYTDSQRNEPYRVSLTVPQHWRSISGLPYGTNNQQFIAKNYDELVDSPIETGINQAFDFKVDGRDYQLVIWGRGNYDSDKMVADLSKLVKQGSHIWADYPFERYVFMVHATSGARGATEHVNSTIIQRDRYKFNDRKDYLGFLKTASHEFVHTWNVKQYRPAGLVPYDYQQENYSNLIWLSEGSTSYFQSQLLLNAGLMSFKEFCDDLAKRINAYQRKPGRFEQSIADSSFDHWIEEYGDYGNNFGVNIYSEGFMTSWLLDMDLLIYTKGKSGYRNVHNALYQQFRLPKSFNEQDILAIIEAQTGMNYQKWWQKNVHGSLDINFDSLLNAVGLELVKGDKTKAWSGVRGKKADSGFQLSAVEKDSPAWLAGLTTDDIIIAVNGLRLKNADWNARIKNFKAGDVIAVDFFRNDELQQRKITLGSLPKSKLKIQKMKSVTAQQKRLFKAWTGIDWPEGKDKKS